MTRTRARRPSARIDDERQMSLTGLYPVIHLAEIAPIDRQMEQLKNRKSALARLGRRT